MYRGIIAEDVQIVREAIVNQLDWKAMGVQLAGAFPNGERAFLFLQEHPVNLLITDIRMPRMDGLALIKETKAVLPDIQIILVSAYNDFEYAREALRYGAVDFISKPVQFPELSAAVQKAVNRLEGNDKLKRQETMVRHLLKNEFPTVAENPHLLEGEISLKKLKIEKKN